MLTRDGLADPILKVVTEASARGIFQRLGLLVSLYPADACAHAFE